MFAGRLMNLTGGREEGSGAEEIDLHIEMVICTRGVTVHPQKSGMKPDSRGEEGV